MQHLGPNVGSGSRLDAEHSDAEAEIRKVDLV
jgi:hypothetical protein